MAFIRSMIALIAALMRRSDRAELGLIAAGVAFFGFLAIFPTVAVIIAVWGFVADPAIIQQDLALLKGLLPDEAFVLLSAQVEGLLTANNRQLGWTTVLSTCLAIWAARAGTAAESTATVAWSSRTAASSTIGRETAGRRDAARVRSAGRAARAARRDKGRRTTQGPAAVAGASRFGRAGGPPNHAQPHRGQHIGRGRRWRSRRGR